MDIMVEPREEQKQWKLWVIDGKDKFHVGTVFYSQGEHVLHTTVKELLERYKDEFQNLLHNTAAMKEHDFFYSDHDVPYIQMQYTNE